MPNKMAEEVEEGKKCVLLPRHGWRMLTSAGGGRVEAMRDSLNYSTNMMPYCMLISPSSRREFIDASFCAIRVRSTKK